MLLSQRMATEWLRYRWHNGLTRTPPYGPRWLTNQLPSGKADNTVQFTYTVSEQNSPGTDQTRVNMDGGVFRLDIHSSWTVATKNITILDALLL